MAIIKATTITGATGDNQTSSRTTAVCYAIRVGGTGNLAGAVQIKNGTAVIETLAIATTPGTQREYYGTLFDQGLVINLANAADTVIAIWSPA
jgi:hypothetical protein